MSDQRSVYYVYVIATTDNEPSPLKSGRPVKIGISKNPAARLAEIQVGNPLKLQIATFFPLPGRAIALEVERACHEMLSEHSLTGEWFDISALNAIAFVCHVLRLTLNEGRWSEQQKSEWLNLIRVPDHENRLREIIASMGKADGAHTNH